MTTQPDLEALLRAAYPDDVADAALTRFGLLNNFQPGMRRILAWHIAEKAKAYELGHSVGQHDAATGKDVRAVEAAALERAKGYFVAAFPTIADQMTRHFDALISPSRTALSERDFDKRIEGERIGARSSLACLAHDIDEMIADPEEFDLPAEQIPAYRELARLCRARMPKAETAADYLSERDERMREEGRKEVINGKIS